MVGLARFELAASGFVDRRSDPDELQPHLQNAGAAFANGSVTPSTHGGRDIESASYSPV
jgi:hypothetical protein